VGYRGKVEEQEKARLMRAENRTLKEIAEILGVSKSSVSLWVRDMNVEIRQARPGVRRSNKLHEAKLAEIEACDRLGIERIGQLSDDAFLAAGVALYAGEGSKTGNEVNFANTDAAMVAFYCAWLRRFFEIDESRMRVRVYLHEGLDLDAAETFWSGVTAIPRAQFRSPYRAKADPTIRRTKHEHGCVYVRYCCARTLREIKGLIRALLSSGAIPG
jgi:transcriptional regulator with XRE-family HTH domain